MVLPCCFGAFANGERFKLAKEAHFLIKTGIVCKSASKM